MEEQKKMGILTRAKRKLEMNPVPIVPMEEQKKKKKKGNLTLGKRKIGMDDNPIAHLEEQKKKGMDDNPIAHMEAQKKKGNLALVAHNKKWKMEICSTAAESPIEKQKEKKGNSILGKRELEMDANPIARMEEQKNLALVAHNKKWKMEICSTAAESPHQKLPHEVIVDEILTRLPIRNLAKECALVCKLWYKSILHPHFIFLHTLHQSACRNPNLIFDILNSPRMRMEYPRQCTLMLDIHHVNDNNDAVHNFHKLSDIGSIGKQEPVGHCNGLQCLRSSCVRGDCIFHITNPSCRPNDFMAAVYPVPDKAFIFCCGFGFDSLINEYKIVLVYSNSSNVIDVHDKFKCMVFTLGSRSWRESTTPNTLPVMTIGGTGIIQKKMKKRVILSRMSFSRSAIYVGGALYWRVLTREGFGRGIGDEEDEEDQETEMLLCFDIHHEQFELVYLPLECELKIKTGTTTMTTEQEQQLIDHRLLEFEGYPCIARLQTGGQQQRNINCCCKVLLYILKDRVKSAWSIEAFDVCSTSMIQDMYSNPPCIIATSTSSKTTTTITITTATTLAAAAATTTNTRTTSTSHHTHQPKTQILCVSGRVILYWFDGLCVQLYDLRRKRLKMVKYTPDPSKEGALFTRTGPGQLWPYNIDNVDITNKLIFCRRDHMDYKLHIYAENSLPLKTFIPEGCTVSRNYEKWYSENKDIKDGLGFVYTIGKNGMLHFHCFGQRLSMEGSR